MIMAMTDVANTTIGLPENPAALMALVVKKTTTIAELTFENATLRKELHKQFGARSEKADPMSKDLILISLLAEHVLHPVVGTSLRPGLCRRCAPGLRR
jgi:hypothetical protein